MNKKTKITVTLIGMATAVFVVAFFVKKPIDSNDVVKTEKSKFEKPSNKDEGHTIEANLNVHVDEEDQDQSHPTITVTPGSVTTEENKWENAFFNNYVDQTLKGLPTLDQTKDLEDKDVHHTPSFIMETGLRLGKIKKQVKLNKDFAPKAMEFYEACAMKNDSFTPIRGLCLANLIYMKKELGEDFDPSPFPEEVKDLAKKALEFSF